MAKKRVENITGVNDNFENPEPGDVEISTSEEVVDDISENNTVVFRDDWRETEELKALTFLTQSLYQIQHLRIGLGNRIYAHCAVNLGIQPGMKKDDSKQAATVMKKLMSEYKDITTALADSILSAELREKLIKKKIDVDALVLNNPQAFLVKNSNKINKAIDEVANQVNEVADLNDAELLVKHFSNGLIRNDAEFQMARMWAQLRSIESGIADELANIIKNCHFDIWDSFLIGVDGIGPTLASCLISTINMKKCYTVQSLWKYCGLDVFINKDGVGEGRSRKAEHMEERDYIDKEGNVKKKLSLTYNPWLKTKLMGTIAGMFMQLNKDYRAIYDDIKLRLNNSERPEMMRPRVKNGQPVINKKTGEPELVQAYPKARINMMSQRYMIKMFLLDYWVHGRILLGEPLKVPYAQEKLGYKCKFRTFIYEPSIGKKVFTRIDFEENLDLNMLNKIQQGPASKYAR